LSNGRVAFLAAAGVAIWWFVLDRLPVAGQQPFFHPVPLGLTFNSMAEHLLQGRFDVDPDAVVGEAFFVGDRAISYFGIFCALLRLPLWPLGVLGTLDITAPSCAVAVGLGAWFQMWALLDMRDACPAGARRTWLTIALGLCIILGGQQIQFARSSIYQEVLCWGNALAMGFVWLAIRGLLSGFATRRLTAMAAFAGLALLERVSFGIGMYAALGGVLLLHWRRMVWPAVVLGVFVAATAVVNYGRWGDPTVFADFTKYALNQDQTSDRLVRLAQYGTFNWRRLGLGLSYYFVPVWMWIRTDGHLLFAEARDRLVDVFELPPGSFLLSDPLLLWLAGAGVSWRACRSWSAVSLLAGFAIPPLLMLTAISMAYRYREEFYPFLVLAALLGVRRLCAGGTGFGRGARVWIVAAVIASVAVSHGLAVIYAISPFGDSGQYVEPDGWLGTYLPRLRAGHD
jgi:hypothetical protein